MTKVFHFDVPRENYVADAAIIWCFDHRFHLPFSKFLKKIGIVWVDVIKLPGGVKSLASPACDTDREFVLRQIRTAIRLHQPRLVILMAHSDCGGYGGLEAFGGDTEREAQHHAGELQRAAEIVRSAIPEVDVQAYFVDFEGIWAVELTGTASSMSAKSA